MFIIGNAEQMASGSKMWQTIINELSEADAIGPGWPIACSRHGEVKSATKPGDLDVLSPDGAG